MWHSELPQGISTCGQRGFKSEHTCQISSLAAHADSSENPRRGDQKALGVGESCWAGLQPHMQGMGPSSLVGHAWSLAVRSCEPSLAVSGFGGVGSPLPFCLGYGEQQECETSGLNTNGLDINEDTDGNA